MATEDIRSFAFNVAKEAGYDVKCEIDPLPLSDHVPFQAHGVPTAWLWGGALSMFYHTAKDDPETLDYDKCKQLADVNGELVYKIATEEVLPFGKN